MNYELLLAIRLNSRIFAKHDWQGSLTYVAIRGLKSK